MRWNNAFLICFTGIDGSGKTTHAKSLMNFLSKRGYSCAYVWAASRPILSLTFFAFTRILGYWKKTKEGEYTDPLEFAPERLRVKLGVVWRFFIFVDYQIKITILIRTRLLLGRTVVCDRYIYDMIMELSLSQLYTTRFGNLLGKTVPWPEVTFLMDVADETASSRRLIPAAQLSARRRTFLDLSKIFDTIIINSNENFVDNSHQIQIHTLRRLGR